MNEDDQKISKELSEESKELFYLNCEIEAARRALISALPIIESRLELVDCHKILQDCMSFIDKAQNRCCLLFERALQ